MKSRFPIVEETRFLVRKENELCAQIIRNLQKIMAENIPAAMGYSGIFSFCVEELGMSEATAHRRFDALKLSQVIPELPAKIETGEVSLSRVGEVSRYLRTERKETGRVVPKDEIRELFDRAVQVSNDFEARKILMASSSAPVRPIADQTRVVAGGRTVLTFEVDAECLELLEIAKDLHSHKGPRKMGEIFKDILKVHLQLKHPEFKRESKRNIRVQSDLLEQSTPPVSQKGLSSESRVPKQPPSSKGADRSPEKRSRYIPKQIATAVWRRDQSRCTHVDPVTGRRCESRFRIQLDHLIPFSRGGGHSLQNLVLKCQTHNLYSAEQMGLPFVRKNTA